MEEPAPRAFVSYTHADREPAEFIVRYLLDNGVKTFSDFFDIQPGDSLIDRIFREGIPVADVFVLVWSKQSASSNWMKEELDAALIRRIESTMRVIPVVLDSGPAPEPVRHLLRIDLGQDRDQGLRRLVDAIHGISNKPAVGAKPAVVTAAPQIPGLSTEAAFVGRAIALNFPEDGSEYHLLAEQLEELLAEINPEAALDALKELQEQALLKVGWHQGLKPFEQFAFVRPRAALFAKFAECLPYKPDVDLCTVAAAIAAAGTTVFLQGAHLFEKTQLPPSRINRAVEVLLLGGLVHENKLSGQMPYTFGYVTAKASLKAWVQQNCK